MIILDVLNTTGITATAGIGTNMYLAKIAMDMDFVDETKVYATETTHIETWCFLL